MCNTSGIFSIIIKNEKGEWFHKGTGFLISSNGYFITAGHTFDGYSNLKERFFCVFPENKVDTAIYKIEYIKYKHEYLENQKSPVYIDYAIGKIEIVDVHYYILNRKRPHIDHDVFLRGYFSNGAKLNLNENGNLDLKTIYPDNLDATVKSSYSDILIPRNLVDGRNVSRYFNNSFIIYRYSHKGSSGCPVFDKQGLVVGMFISMNNELQESYIITSKYLGKKVCYNTEIIYDRFKDLEFRIK